MARSNIYCKTIESSVLNPGYNIILPAAAPTLVDDVLSVSNTSTGQTVWKHAETDRHKVHGYILKTADKVCGSGDQSTVFPNPVTVTAIGQTEYNIRFSGWCIINGAVTSIAFHLEWDQGADQEIVITAPITAGAKQVFNVDFTAFGSDGPNTFNIGCKPLGGTDVTWYSGLGGNFGTSFTITEISEQI